ncbi:MAG TPA: efflux RND transporter periplasmic adaptor subunit [Bryobacteraceae bacterium]|nr:efflux RND transporter periplasmic adaptor subunit [Bryobacteraceae bacterium]
MNISQRNKQLSVAACLILTCSGFLAIQGCANKSTQAAGGRRGDGAPVPVAVTIVSQKDVPVNIDVIGNVEAYSTISVKAQVGGQLTNVPFQEGQFVKKGEVLFSIDARPFEAALSQAQANLSRDTAAQGQAEANLARDSANEKYAQSQAARYQKLFDAGVVSKEQSDQIRASADALAQTILADKAAIESARAQIVASKAAIETTQVQLSYTTIKSPIDGRTGNLSVKQGNVVAANVMELVTIAEVSPIYVTFSVPESQLTDIKRYMAQGKLQVVAAPQDNNTDKESGFLTFVDNNVDASTGTIKLKGTFQNADRKLWPGEFVRVTLRLTMQTNAVVVPNQAVQTGQEGPFVYVVNGDNDKKKVEMRPVVTGTRVDQDLVIDRGLQAGETVVIEGQLRLAPGSPVQIREPRRALPGGGPGGGGRRGPQGKAT